LEELVHEGHLDGGWLEKNLASPPYLVLLSFRGIYPPSSGAVVPIFVSHEGYKDFEEGGLNLPLIRIRCVRDV
jgi:hypothetical protein